MGTKTGKLCRKRLLEVLSKKSLEARLVEIINSERDHMVAKIEKLGKNGTVAFQSFDTVVSCGLNVILQFALGIDLSDDPERLSRLNKVLIIFAPINKTTPASLKSAFGNKLFGSQTIFFHKFRFQK